MFKIIKKLNAVRVLLLSSLVVGFLFFGSYVLNVSAETKNAGPLKIEYSGIDPLFSATNIAPGYSETKTLTITNQGTIPHSFAIVASGTLGDLANVLRLAPKVSGVAVWDETIAALADGNSHTIVGSILPGGAATVDLMAYLPDSVGNDYQGSSTLAFDFIVGDQEPEPEVSILAPPSGGRATGGAYITGVMGDTLGVSTSPSISPSASVSPSPQASGEVKGEENGTADKGLDWKLLLIVPVVGLLAIWLLPVNLAMVIAIPVVPGLAAAILGIRSHGSLKPIIFWIILIVEIILVFGIEFYRWWQTRENEEEEEEL